MAVNDKYLGEFEQMVLLTIMQLGDAAYGASIRQFLHEKIGRDVSLGALYATIERMEKKGLVTSKLGESTAQRGGRPKRFVAVTGQGQASLKRAREAMNTLWQNVALLSIV